ncbi:SIS domain-containing protein [Mesorhizobium sp. CAU 1732]|uniref:SIS domain-containing protein n=1 Tax=Mesorhizobium sp. CAU 1732 TaxID=3140358 RepID=UPI0032604205
MTQTMMASETREIPSVVARQIEHGMDAYAAMGTALRERAPAFLVTSARGTSDHAATYLKYLVETRLGIAVASMGPSVASIYKTSLQLRQAGLVAISQSGASPDLISLLEAGREGGALTMALVNAEGAPASDVAELAAPLLAGPEKAVAASKSYVASLVAIAAIVASWSRDDELLAAIRMLPKALEAALACDWSDANASFSDATSAFCLSRGPALTIAYEAALKLKETCAVHAEGFSTAEVLHGPLVLAGEGLRALVFVPRDEARSGVIDTTRRLSAAGADVWLAGGALGDAVRRLPCADAPHPALDPICQAVSFYVFVEQLSRLRGNDPDRPAHLRKVTETI